MKIAVIGTGYVGLVSGACYSEFGNEVVCIDNDIMKIDNLKNGIVPIYEPGLKEIVNKNMEKGRLSFSTSIEEAINAELFLIAVGTPSLANGEADLQYIREAIQEVAAVIRGYAVIVIKSTVPVGTNEQMKKVISDITRCDFDIASVPEFLREGSAVIDTLQPDRVIIGAESNRASELLIQLHSPFNAPIIVTDLRSAEMIKYASNAFLATKISFINEIANICEKVGANIEEVSKGMGLDHRIGPEFLKAGIGYGGSCFPKDTKALIQIAGNADYDFKLLKAVVEVNQMQRFSIINKLYKALGNLKGKVITLLGLSFKPGTDDIRESPAIDIVQQLLKDGAMLKLYDPVAVDNFRRFIDHPNIEWSQGVWEAVSNSEAVCLLTEWEEFKQINLHRLSISMKIPILIDGRNAFIRSQVEEEGILYYPVGMPYNLNEKILEGTWRDT